MRRAKAGYAQPLLYSQNCAQQQARGYSRCDHFLYQAAGHPGYHCAGHARCRVRLAQRAPVGPTAARHRGRDLRRLRAGGQAERPGSPALASAPVSSNDGVEYRRKRGRAYVRSRLGLSHNRPITRRSLQPHMGLSCRTVWFREIYARSMTGNSEGSGNAHQAGGTAAPVRLACRNLGRRAALLASLA
jgi:hypothetical protein